MKRRRRQNTGESGMTGGRRGERNELHSQISPHRFERFVNWRFALLFPSASSGVVTIKDKASSTQASACSANKGVLFCSLKSRAKSSATTCARMQCGNRKPDTQRKSVLFFQGSACAAHKLWKSDLATGSARAPPPRPHPSSTPG